MLFRRTYQEFVGKELANGLDESDASAIDDLYNAVLLTKTMEEVKPDILKATKGCSMGLHYAGSEKKFMEDIGYKGQMVNLAQIMHRIGPKCEHGDRRNKGALRACSAGAGGHAGTRWSTSGQLIVQSARNDSARAAVPGLLAGQPHFSRPGKRVEGAGSGGGGPRDMGATGGRPGVAARQATGTAAVAARGAAGPGNSDTDVATDQQRWSTLGTTQTHNGDSPTDHSPSQPDTKKCIQVGRDTYAVTSQPGTSYDSIPVIDSSRPSTPKQKHTKKRKPNRHTNRHHSREDRSWQTRK